VAEAQKALRSNRGVIVPTWRLPASPVSWISSASRTSGRVWCVPGCAASPTDAFGRRAESAFDPTATVNLSHTTTGRSIAYKLHWFAHKSKETKVLPEPQDSAYLRFLSPQPDTSSHCEITDTRLVHRAVCLFTSYVSLVRIAPAHRGMARLSWPGWLVTYPDGLPACRRSPIQILTGPGVNFVDATNDVIN